MERVMEIVRGLDESQVGQTIFKQFGGNRAMAMLGGQAMVIDGGRGLGIKWPHKQRSKGNYVEIHLDSDDTYTMTFYNLSIRAKKKVKEYKGIYADKLRDVFEDQTGWKLRL